MKITTTRESKQQAMNGKSTLKEKLVNALMDESAPPHLHTRLMTWFDQDAHNEEKQEALTKFMYEHLKPNEDLNHPVGSEWFCDVARRLALEVPKKEQKRNTLLKRRLSRFFIGTFSAAAVFLIGLFILPELHTEVASQQAGVASENLTIAAAHESPREITLPDGSVVKLKGATTITYADRFEQDRRIAIDGEAYFIVTRDEQHPFRVACNGVEVTVLGTEFYIKAPKDDSCAEVTLTTGQVHVSYAQSVVTLLPSEKAIIDRTRHTIDLDEIGRGELLRLRGINLALEDVTLDEAFSIIGDYYQVRVNVSGHIASSTGGLVVKLNDNATLEETLSLLQAINPVFDYRIGNGQVMITKNK